MGQKRAGGGGGGKGKGISHKKMRYIEQARVKRRQDAGLPPLPTLESIEKGVIVTGDVSFEGRMILDAYRLLGVSADAMYGPEPALAAENGGDDDDTGDASASRAKEVGESVTPGPSIADDLEAELAALRGEGDGDADDGEGDGNRGDGENATKGSKPRRARRFTSVATKIGGVGVIRIDDAAVDPTDLVNDVIARQLGSEEKLSRFVSRVRPVQWSCRALPVSEAAEEIADKVKPTFERILAEGGKEGKDASADGGDAKRTFAIEMRVRNNDGFKKAKMDAIRGIAAKAAVPEGAWRADLSGDADVTVLVDVMGRMCFFSAVENYKSRRCFNLGEVHKLAAGDAGEKDTGSEVADKK